MTATCSAAFVVWAWDLTVWAWRWAARAVPPVAPSADSVMAAVPGYSCEPCHPSLAVQTWVAAAARRAGLGYAVDRSWHASTSLSLWFPVRYDLLRARAPSGSGSHRSLSMPSIRERARVLRPARYFPVERPARHEITPPPSQPLQDVRDRVVRRQRRRPSRPSTTRRRNAQAGQAGVLQRGPGRRRPRIGQPPREGVASSITSSDGPAAHGTYGWVMI